MIFEGFFKNKQKMTRLPKEKSAVPEHQPISGDCEADLHALLDFVGNPSDLVIHRMENNQGTQVVTLLYLTSLASGTDLASHVVEPINCLLINLGAGNPDPGQVKRVLVAAQITETNDLHQAVEYLLKGQALLLISGGFNVLSVSFFGFQHRQIEEPPTERVIKGPREGFNEVLTDNLGMIRRWVRDPNLRVEGMTVGERTKTELAILYLNGVANPNVVCEVKKRLAEIKIDGILDSGYLLELITDNRLTLFPLIQETERPDKVVSGILEGRVAILVDKSPFALVVPMTSTEFYQTPEDFYLNYWVGSFIRVLRGLGTFLAVTLPGLYVSLVATNPTLIPANLVQILASGRTQVPIPLIFEILLVSMVFEIFREAVIRVPSNINIVLGIAGGVLAGLVAVESGLVSGPTLIVVIIASLASFTTSSVSKEQAWRIVRYFLLLAAGGFGIMGLTLSGILVLTHMASLKSFGVSYLGPWAPPISLDIIDAYFRIPWWLSYRRPPTYRPRQEERLGDTGEEEP